MSAELLDSAGRPRSPATLPGYRLGCPPRNKGRRYPADPPRLAGTRGSDRTALGTEIAGTTLWRCVACRGRRVSDRDQRCRLDSFDQRPRL
jgi:hypothetical protein